MDNLLNRDQILIVEKSNFSTFAMITRLPAASSLMFDRSGNEAGRDLLMRQSVPTSHVFGSATDRIGVHFMMKSFVVVLLATASSFASAQAIAQSVRGVDGSTQSSATVTERGGTPRSRVRGLDADDSSVERRRSVGVSERAGDRRAVRSRGAGQPADLKSEFQGEDDVLSTGSLGTTRNGGRRRVDILSSTGKVHSVPALDIDAALDATFDADDE